MTKLTNFIDNMPAALLFALILLGMAIASSVTGR
jgi:hypothetical protein